MTVVGGYVNVARLPERYAAGKFDWGRQWGVNSHVVVHVLTALGTAAVGTASYSDCSGDGLLLGLRSAKRRRRLHRRELNRGERAP